MALFNGLFRKNQPTASMGGVKPDFSKKTTVEKPEEVPNASIGNITATAEPVEEGLSVDQIKQLYIQNSWIRKYINTIVRACLKYKLQAVVVEDYKGSTTAEAHAKEVNDLLKYSNETEAFTSVRKKYLNDLLLYGNGAVEIAPKVGTPKFLYAAPGYMLRVDTDSSGNIKDPKMAYYFLPVGSTNIEEKDKTVEKAYPSNAIVHLKLDELSDRVYGISPMDSIVREITADVKSLQDLQKGDYGIAPQLIKFPKQSKAFVEGVVKLIQQVLTGKGGNKVIGVNVDADHIKLSDKKYTDEFEFQKWLVMRHNIYGIPPFKLGFVSEVGSMSAREQREEFLGLIETLVQYECEVLTLVLLKNRLGYKDIEIVCPALITRLDFEKARVLDRLVGSGIVTSNEAREKYLGLPRSSDPKADRLNIDLPESSIPPTSPTT